MWTKEFWLDLLERTIATFAEVMLGYITVKNGPINWREGLSVAGVAALGAVFKCIVLKSRTIHKDDSLE